MALVLADRVKVSTTTTGTGTYTLGSAATGYQDFSVIGNTNTTFYTVTNGTDWEVGIGTYTSSGTTLSRDTILSSSNAGSAVNWGAGTKEAFVTYPSGKSVIEGGSPTFAKLGLGGWSGSSGAGLSVQSAATSAGPIVAKTTNYDTVWSILPWASGITYISSGIYYNGGSWVHASADTTNCLFAIQGAGPRWYSSNNSSGSWNLAADVSLWNSAGRWVNDVTSPTDVRAPIFYDSNDTGYYLDPNSTSDSALRIRGGALHGPNVTWGKYLLVGGDGRQGYTNNADVASVCTTDGNLHIDAASEKGLYLNFYDGNLVNFGNGANAVVSTINPDGSHRAQIFYDYNDTTYYLNPNGYSQINGNGSVNGSAGVGFNIYSVSNNGAIMAFHKGGHFAVNFGLDTDNVMRIGGWSAAANRWQLDMSGNMTAAGSVTAFSDERLKKDWEELPSNFVERLSEIKCGTYTRTDEDMRQIGVSAQSLQKLSPEAVLQDATGTLSVAYGNAALAACVQLAKEVVAIRAHLNI
jgi:hypothetical protein